MDVSDIDHAVVRALGFPARQIRCVVHLIGPNLDYLT
jgi:hypothetical protein